MAGLVYDFLTGGDRMKDEENINNQVGFEIHRTAHMMSRRLEGNVKDRGIDEVSWMDHPVSV